jgi:hypothetical protein
VKKEIKIHPTISYTMKYVKFIFEIFRNNRPINEITARSTKILNGRIYFEYLPM